MKKRIFISVFVLSLLVIIASFIFSSFTTYSGFITERDKQLSIALNNIASIENNRNDTIELLKNLIYSDFRISYISDEGMVLYDSKADSEYMESHKERDEFEKAISTGKGSDVRQSNTIGEEYHYQARKLKNGDVLRFSYATRSVVGLMQDSLLKMLLLSFIMLIICLFAANIISNIIIKPINEASLNPEEYIGGYDELAPFQQKILMQKNELMRRVEESENNTEQFNQVLNSIQEGLVILDKDMNIMSINDSARKIFKYDGKKNEHIFNACREEGFREFIKAFSEGGKDKYIYKIDDSVYSMHASTVFKEKKQHAYVLLIQNITADFYNEKLRREFTSNVSHELKTPLTTISGLTELIVSGMAKKEDIPKFASKISAESKRLVRLIDDIIRLTRIDEGQNLQMKAIDISKIASEQVERYRSISDNDNIKLDAEPAMILGEEQLLSEIISNLIDNAIKYNKPGVNILVKVKNKNNGVLLSVEDDGIGIEPKHHARIFERFYRVDKSRSRNTGGTGLGLSIVKNAAVLHNAKLDIESDIGKGCKIKIKFPPMQKA